MTDRGRVYKGEQPLCANCLLPLQRMPVLRPGDKVRDETGGVGIVVSNHLNSILWDAVGYSYRTPELPPNTYVRYVDFSSGENHIRRREDLTLVHGYLHVDPAEKGVF